MIAQAKPKIVFAGTTARLLIGEQEIGRAVYAMTAPKVVQIVELKVLPKYRRKGHGSRLLRQIVTKAQPEKVWFGVRHKEQIIARAFLTKNGFHHISTTSNLLRDEDLLIYVKSWV